MRLFIAINLPEEIKNKIEEAMKKINPELSQKIDNYPAHFSPKKNWHLTITFLGYQPQETVNSVLESIKETTTYFNPPKIDFENISYGPLDSPARMVWLVGAEKTSRTLAELKIKLEDALIKNGVKFKQEKRAFSTHVTLVRFREPLGRLPDRLITPLSLSFEAQSLDLMESHLKRAGSEYETVSQFAFKLPVL